MLTVDHLEISGTADDLHALATLLSTVPPGAAATRGPVRVLTTTGPMVTINLDGDVLVFAGPRDHLLTLALDIRGVAQAERHMAADISRSTRHQHCHSG